MNIIFLTICLKTVLYIQKRRKINMRDKERQRKMDKKKWQIRYRDIRQINIIKRDKEIKRDKMLGKRIKR